MGLQTEQIPWIPRTPLGISLRSIEYFPPHYHENVLEILFCLKGSITFSYGYEEFLLGPGDFISIDHDVHFLSEGKDNIVVSFYIDIPWFTERHEYITSTYFICEGLGDYRGGRANFDNLRGVFLALLFFMIYGKESRVSRKEYIRGADRIVDIMMKHFSATRYYDVHLQIDEEEERRYGPLQKYMQENYMERIAIADLAKMINLSESYLSHRLSKTMIGFRNTLQYIRASKSEILLLTTDFTIEQIAAMCGFSDKKYYYSAFRKWYGCTPFQYRKRYEEHLRREPRFQTQTAEELAPDMGEFIKNYYIDRFLRN